MSESFLILWFVVAVLIVHALALLIEVAKIHHRIRHMKEESNKQKQRLLDDSTKVIGLESAVDRISTEQVRSKAHFTEASQKLYSLESKLERALHENSQTLLKLTETLARLEGTMSSLKNHKL